MTVSGLGFNTGERTHVEREDFRHRLAGYHILHGRRCAAGRLRLADEPFPGFLVLGQLSGEGFDRHQAMQGGVLSLIDGPHATLAEPIDDRIVTYRFPDHSGADCTGNGRFVNAHF